MVNLIATTPKPNGTTVLVFAVSASDRVQVVVPTISFTPASLEAVRRQVESRFQPRG